MSIRTFIVRLLCGAAAIEGPPAMAQDAASHAQMEADLPSAGLGDIVVTARRQSESLQDVPVAVAVVSQAQLQNNLATDLSKIAELAPQVMIGRQTVGTGAVISIRGISSTSTDPGLDQSVAIAIDNIVLSRGRIVTAAMFDLAQVEVMQGPQALFFGKNSPAGVIAVRSAGPTDKLQGYVRAGYEFTADERYLEAAISGPISDTFGARLAVRYSAMEGWLRNVAVPVADPIHAGVTVPGANNGVRQPNGDNIAGRLTLRWEPEPDLSVELKALGSRERINSSTGYAESYCVNGQSVPRTSGAFAFPTGDCLKNRVKSEGGLPGVYAANYPYGNGGVPEFKSDAVLASIGIEKQIGSLSVISTTGYYQQTITDNRNGDFSPFALIWAVQHEKYRLLTQELRLTSAFEGPLNLSAGAYFEDSSRDFDNYPDLFHAGLNVAANNYTTVETLASADNQSYSFFAQARLKLGEQIELAGGARYSHDSKKQTIVNRTIGVTTFAFRPAGVPLTSRLTDDDVSPEVTLSWKPSRDHLLYGAFKTGYKAGAISTPALLFTSATSNNLQVGAEKARGFEIGYKGDLFDRRLRLNATAYSYRFSNLQLGTFDPATISFRIQNAASARTRGFEASVNWLIDDALTLSGNVAYNDARFRRFRDAQCYPGQTAALGCVGGRQDLTGARLVRAPEWTFNLGANYSVPLSDGWRLQLAGDGTRTSKYQTAADNAPGGIQSGYWRLNAAVHVSTPKDRLRLSIIGRNLTDAYYLVSASGRPSGTANEFIGVFNRPREIVAQVELNF